MAAMINHIRHAKFSHSLSRSLLRNGCRPLGCSRSITTCRSHLMAHEILGVAPSACMDEIKAAYRRKALDLHPDVAPPGTHPNAFKQLQSAYNQMLNPEHADGLDEDPKHHGTYEESAFSPDPSILFGAPAAFLAIAVAWADQGSFRTMLAEEDLIKKGGWVCHDCTCVNLPCSQSCSHCGRKK